MSNMTVKKAKRMRGWASLLFFAALGAVIIPLEIATQQRLLLGTISWSALFLWIAAWTYYIFTLHKRAGSPHPLRDALTS